MCTSFLILTFWTARRQQSVSRSVILFDSQHRVPRGARLNLYFTSYSVGQYHFASSPFPSPLLLLSFLIIFVALTCLPPAKSQCPFACRRCSILLPYLTYSFGDNGVNFILCTTCSQCFDLFASIVLSCC
jgi:hypothetical protein